MQNFPATSNLEAIWEKLCILHIVQNELKTVPQNQDSEDCNPGKYILLVEDDPDDQELLKEVFASIDNSFILKFINHGKEILSYLEKNKNNKPCLIVLDYNMPGLNGAEILREINTTDHYDDIPKIIWSTSGSEKFKSVCLELGASDYILKPSSAKDLENIVHYMLSLCNVTN